MNAPKLRSILNPIWIRIKGVRYQATVSTSENVDVTNLKPFHEIPGPSSLPLIGPLLHFIPGGSLYTPDTKDFSAKLFKLYGPIVKLDPLFARNTLLMVYDPESAANVLRSENRIPYRGGFNSLAYYRKHIKKHENNHKKLTGLITDQGEEWWDLRSTVNPVLLQPKTIKLYSAAIDEVAQEMMNRMKSKLDENNRLQAKFDDEMNLWALESIGVVAFGIRLNCFDPNLAENSPEKKLIECVHQIFNLSNQLDFQPSLWHIFSTPTYKKAMKMFQLQEDLSKYFINKAMRNINKNENKPDEQKGVLEKLLDINEEYAYIMATDMLVAGVDTVANSIAATLYLFAKNPEKQEKLREEVMSKESKRYLKACIKETMRMMPVVSGNLRRTTKEYNILGYHVPKGIDVAFAHQDLSSMEEHYPRPTEFIPERWLADKNDPLYYGKAHPFVMAPFGFGVRSCIGRRIAELEIETFLTKILENFRVEWYGPPPKIIQTSINYFTGPFNFVFNDIKKK
ncbi:cytochrome P450 CYP12A2 isoform X1 [Bombyx mori]|uniref:Cytochrome P450 n=2 Tax=Bombyx mori TaxID=7091 RepID=A0A8R1WIF7_BOMMO|nr:cytochrome P450 CYP12A2 isoform X1 [Bombyx mori]